MRKVLALANSRPSATLSILVIWYYFSNKRTPFYKKDLGNVTASYATV